MNDLVSMATRKSPVLALRFVLALGLALVIPLASAGPVAAAEDPGAPPKLLGMAAVQYQADFETYQDASGRYPALRQAFWTLDDPWPTDSVVDGLDWLDERGIVPFVEITTEDFDDLVAGRLDAKVRGMAQTVADWIGAGDDRRMLIAPLPEANLVDFAWGADPAGYITAYNRIRDAFLDAGLGPEDVRWVFAMHGTSSPGFAMVDFYPGDDVVDVVGFSLMNRNNPWYDYEAAFQPFIDEIKASITQAKPILITQTGSVVETGDRDAWLRDMFRNFSAENQVIGVVYFSRDKFEGGKANDYRVVVDGRVDRVFLQESLAWSPPSEVDWIFDGRMDSWVAARQDIFGSAPFFRDIGDSVFQSDILWLAGEGITAGCNPPVNDRFCPDQPVTRGQMAAFLVRALDPPASGPLMDFSDADGSVFKSDIERLAAAGITAGCNPPVNDRFCPDQPVTRGQMAAFLVRALG
jgi:hypothetical protein